MGNFFFYQTKSVVQEVFCAVGPQFLRYGLEIFRFLKARRDTSIARGFQAQKWPEHLQIEPESLQIPPRFHPSEWLKSTIFLSVVPKLAFSFLNKVTMYGAHRDTSIKHGYMARRYLERPETGAELEWDSGQWAD